MITIKAYSDLEQSKKLAEILPLESADMYYLAKPDDTNSNMVASNICIPRRSENDGQAFGEACAWSLAALLGVLNSIEGWYPGIDSQINGNMWQICMFSYETGSDISTAAINEELVDTCYEVILKLHERKML